MLSRWYTVHPVTGAAVGVVVAANQQPTRLTPEKPSFKLPPATSEYIEEGQTLFAKTKSLSDRLHSLVNNPEPGVIAWQIAVRNTLEALGDLA